MLTRLRSFPYALVRESSVCMHFPYDTRSRLPPFLCASRTRPSVMQALAQSCWLNRHWNSEQRRAKTTRLLFVFMMPLCPEWLRRTDILLAASNSCFGNWLRISARSASIGLICPVATRQLQGYCTISHVLFQVPRYPAVCVPISYYAKTVQSPIDRDARS